MKLCLEKDLQLLNPRTVIPGGNNIILINNQYHSPFDKETTENRKISLTTLHPKLHNSITQFSKLGSKSLLETIKSLLETTYPARLPLSNNPGGCSM